MANHDSIETLSLYPREIFYIGDVLSQVSLKDYPQLFDLMPFKSGWHLELFKDDDWYVARITSTARGEENAVKMAPEEFAIVKEVMDGFQDILPRKLISDSNGSWYRLLPESFYNHVTFTYIRSVKLQSEENESWWEQDIKYQLGCWFAYVLLPELMSIHDKRSAGMKPSAKIFDLGKIIPCVWILESDNEAIQGSAFMLDGIGLVTCAHVLSEDTVAFRSDNFTKKFKIEVIHKNPVIDLAIVKIIDTDQEFPCLRIGDSDNLSVLDEITVVGFPNYRFGDTGIIVSGHISGFRTISGIKRLLTNAPIVAGNSGGPVLNNDGDVIEIAVTGAERIEKAQETENHGAIPISAIEILKA